MNKFLAKKATTLKAIEACRNRLDEKGRICPDKERIKILERVLSTRKPDMDTIAKYKD